MNFVSKSLVGIVLLAVYSDAVDKPYCKLEGPMGITLTADQKVEYGVEWNNLKTNDALMDQMECRTFKNIFDTTDLTKMTVEDTHTKNKKVDHVSKIVTGSDGTVFQELGEPRHHWKVVSLNKDFNIEYGCNDNQTNIIWVNSKKAKLGASDEEKVKTSTSDSKSKVKLTDLKDIKCAEWKPIP